MEAKSEKVVGTVKAISPKDHTIGFLLKENDKQWYNTTLLKEEQKEVLLEDVIRKGNLIEFELTKGYASNFTLLQAAPKETEDGMTNFEDLLTKAHELGGRFSIETVLIENDWEKKTAIVKAKVTVFKSPAVGEVTKPEELYHQVFEAHGDSTQENTDMTQKTLDTYG